MAPLEEKLLHQGSGDDVVKKGSSGISIGMMGKIKRQSKKWREVSHEHAMDEAMAMGMRCRKAGKHATDNWKKADGKEAEGIDLQTNFEAITNLLNNCLGSGILTLSYALSKAGIFTGGVMLTLSCVMNRYTLMLLAKSCEMAEIPLSYSTIGRVALGSVGKYVIMACFTGMGFLCLVSYLDATKDAIEGIINFFHVDPGSNILFLIAVFFNFPPTFIRSLKSVALLSGVAFIGAMVVVICTIIVCGGGLLQRGLPEFSSVPVPLSTTTPTVQLFPDTWATLILQINLFSVIFCIQAGGSIVMSTLKDPSEANTSKVTGLGFGIAFLVNSSVGFLAYLYFTNTVSGDVLKAFDPNSILTLLCKVALLDLVVLSYMFMMIPCRTALLQFFFNKNEARMEASSGQFYGMTLIVNCLASAVAYFVSDVAVVMNVNGTICANLMAWILPAAIYISLMSTDMAKEKKRPVASVRNIPYFCLIIFGCFCMVTGLMGVAGILA